MNSYNSNFDFTSVKTTARKLVSLQLISEGRVFVTTAIMSEDEAIQSMGIAPDDCPYPEEGCYGGLIVSDRPKDIADANVKALMRGHGEDVIGLLRFQQTEDTPVFGLN